MKIPFTIPKSILRYYSQDINEEALRFQYAGRSLIAEDPTWDENLSKSLSQQALQKIIDDYPFYVRMTNELNFYGLIKHEEARTNWEEEVNKYNKLKMQYEEHQKLKEATKYSSKRNTSSYDKFDDFDNTSLIKLETMPEETFPDFKPVKSILDRLNDIDRITVVESLDFNNIPLDIAVSTIPDEHFWERCCLERWPTSFVFEHGGSWRQMFMEIYLSETIENFHPYENDIEDLKEITKLVGHHVKILSISNLIPLCFGLRLEASLFAPIEYDLENVEGEDEGFMILAVEAKKLGIKMPTNNVRNANLKEKINGADEPENVDLDENEDLEKARDSSHLDISLILSLLSNLKKLSIVYELKETGMDYEPRFFEFTMKDCENLAKTLKQCPTIQEFQFNRSRMDGEKCKILVKDGLIHMPALKILDLSYQKIGNSGAKAIARLLVEGSSRSLLKLSIARNQIEDKGGKALAYVLTINNSLTFLDLRLNLIGDGGGRDFANALVKNSSLLYFNLAANRITEKSAYVFGKMLNHNASLKELDLSSNDEIGPKGGEFLADGLRNNKNILKVDLRLCQTGLAFEFDIMENMKKNRMRTNFSLLQNDFYALQKELNKPDEEPEKVQVSPFSQENSSGNEVCTFDEEEEEEISNIE